MDSKPSSIQIIGHRGAAGSAPENTLASFRKAMEEGADALEFDLRTSKDGHLVVIHDASLSRTTDGRGGVSRRTVVQLKELDCGAWYGPQFAGERILTLKEFFEWVAGLPDPKPWLMLDCKSVDLDALATAMREFEGVFRWLVAFHTLRRIRAFREMMPKVPAAYTMARKVPLARLSKADCAAVHPRKELFDEAFREEARRERLAVNVWTVNTPEEIARVGALEPEGIFTNYPKRARELLHV